MSSVWFWVLKSCWSGVDGWQCGGVGFWVGLRVVGLGLSTLGSLGLGMKA